MRPKPSLDKPRQFLALKKPSLDKPRQFLAQKKMVLALDASKTIPIDKPGQFDRSSH